MKCFEAKIQIAAPPATVWRLLTDKTILASEAFDIATLEGDLRQGGRLKLVSTLTPRPFKLKVTTFEPPRVMVWQGGMPLGLFTGTRRFSLTAEGNGTAFQMREAFTGLMLPLIWSSMPDLTPSFTKFAQSLKQRAEAAL